MRLLAGIFLLLSYAGFGQQTSTVTASGNNNVVRVIQGSNIVVYDLADAKQQQLFLHYLETLPDMKKDLRQMLQNTTLIKKSLENGVLNIDIFKKAIDDYRDENNRLRAENEQLRKQTSDPDFAKALEEANNKLEVYDNPGYQETLEKYKIQKKNKLQEARKEIAGATYLQAQNSFNNYYYEKALDQINETVNFDSENADYLIMKGKILFLLARNDESIDVNRKALSLPMDDTARVGVYSDIGLAYKTKSDYDQALEYYSKGLAICEKRFGQEDSNTAVVYNNIGELYNERGDYDKALEYHNKDLAIYEKIFGKDHPETAGSYINIGAIYNEKGEFDKAVEYLQRGLTIFEKKFGKEDPQTGTAYNNIGGIYKEAGDYDKALEYFEKGLAINEAVFGKGHPETGTSYNNIGLAYSGKGDYDKALEYCTKDLDICEKILGKDHPETANCYNNVGTIYYRKGDPDKALEYLGKALNIEEKAFGTDHPNVANTYNNIGTIYKETGDYDKALEYLNKALPIQEKMVGKEHPTTQTLYYSIGTVYVIKGAKDNGMSYLNKIDLSAYEKANLLNNDGISLFNKKKYTESIRLYLLSLEFLAKTDTLPKKVLQVALYQNLAKAYCYAGQKSKAMPLFEKALGLAKELKDEDIDIEHIKKNYEECKAK